MKFGQKIKEIRKGKGYTLNEVGTKVPITPSYLSDIEKGRRNAPTGIKLDNLIGALTTLEEDKILLYDLAAKTRNDVTKDLKEVLANDEKVKELVRVILNKNLTENEIDTLIRLIK